MFKQIEAFFVPFNPFHSKILNPANNFKEKIIKQK